MSSTPTNSKAARVPLAVLISGTGRTLQNLIELERRDRGGLPLDIRLVIASRFDSGGLRFAEQAGIPTCVLAHPTFPSTESFSQAIFAEVRQAAIPYIVLAGFLKRLVIPPDFEQCVINIHPSLLPAFGGQGFYGHRVHEAVIESGARVTGCTVHFVDNEYDHGPVILQKTVPVMDDDTPDLLAARVFEAEKSALPEAIRLLVAGSVRVQGQPVRWHSR